MSDFNRPGVTVERPPRRRSAASRFGDLGERLSRTFGGSERSKPEFPAWDTAEFEYGNQGDTVAWAPNEQRFPTVGHGYDPEAVEAHIDSLERELAELRAEQAANTSVTAEFDRIGDQTAAILRTAYEQAKEITHEAKDQADHCLQDAASNAVSMTEDAKRRLRQLDHDTEAVWQERNRLLDDARAVASELIALADSAVDRFPAEPDKSAAEAPASGPRASAPAGQAAPSHNQASHPFGQASDGSL